MCSSDLSLGVGVGARMSDRIQAAVARLIARRAAGINIAGDDKDIRKRLVASHRMGDRPDEKAGRRRERSGRFVPFRSEP